MEDIDLNENNEEYEILVEDNHPNSTKCVVCHENGTVMKLTHTCGSWYIHDKCLTHWFELHPNECFICRSKYTNTDAKLISNIGADLSYLLVNNSEIEINRKLARVQIVTYCLPILCCALLINIILIAISVSFNFLLIQPTTRNTTYI